MFEKSEHDIGVNMTEQSTEALIAESREVARQYDPAFRFVLTRVIDRLEAVAKDSSTGQQMHAHWQRRAEELADALEAADQRAAELAAVVESAVATGDQSWGTENFDWYDVRDLLATAPADALRDHDANVWDEGVNAEARTSVTARPRIENPYRSAS